jgi:diguanylate cyclase (GGDEF)-like protein
MGGDEFVLVFPGTSAKTALKVVERVLRALHVPCEIFETAIEMTASIGVSVFPEDGLDTQSLLRRADAAMYQAKAGGGGFVFTSGLSKTNGSRSNGHAVIRPRAAARVALRTA